MRILLLFLLFTTIYANDYDSLIKIKDKYAKQKIAQENLHNQAKLKLEQKRASDLALLSAKLTLDENGRTGIPSIDNAIATMEAEYKAKLADLEATHKNNIQNITAQEQKEVASFQAKMEAKAKAKKQEQREAFLKNPTFESSGFMLGLGGVYSATWLDSYTYSYELGETGRFIEHKGGYEILAGYKWFFKNKGNFGNRVFIKYDGAFKKNIDSHLIGINYDLLFNVYNSPDFRVGMILGFSFLLGKEKMVQYTRNYYSYSSGYELKKYYIDSFGIYHGFDVGVRFVFNDSSAIEILTYPRINFGEFAFNITANLRFVYTF